MNSKQGVLTLKDLTSFEAEMRAIKATSRLGKTPEVKDLPRLDKMDNKMRWSFYQVWNESLEQRENRPTVARDRIWASELGKSLVDNYLKLKGVEPSNPFDARSLRKFEAGNIWEWFVGLILKRAGVYLGTQGWVEYQYPGLLNVTGKLDFLAGGKPDWEKSFEEIKELDLPEFFGRATNAIIDYFKKTYPDGMEEIVLEIKSVGSYMFEKYWNTGIANPNHRLQAFHYLKATGKPEAHVVYISKDDARMVEIGLMNPSPVEKDYKDYIEELTGYYKANQRPPLEKEIVFDEETGRFSVNWKVMYSPYLTMLYGYKDQAEFDGKYRGQVNKWNRVLGRIVEGKKMTKLNLEVVKEIEKNFKDIDKIVDIAKEVRETKEEVSKNG